MASEVLTLKESELAKTVISYLQDLKWDVYQEVKIFQGGNIADIVAVQRPVTWVIETKMTLSLAVIGQAYEWTHLANRVSVAVPYSNRHVSFANKILRDYGIGLLRVGPAYFEWEQTVKESIHPNFNHRVGRHLLDGLREGHKTYAQAGNDEGRHWSPFKETCLQVYRFVEAHEGCFLKELIESVPHHYHSNSTARICIVKWALAGEIEGIHVTKEDGKWRFYVSKGENTF